MTLTNYVIRRLIGMVPLLIGISMINFALYAFAPVNPIDARLFAKKGISQDELDRQREMLEKDYGYDKPVWRRYLDYMFGDNWDEGKIGGVVTLDFGHSWEDQTEKVQDRIFPFIQKTLLLFGIGFILSLAFATIVGVVSATRQYSIWDKTGMLANLVGYSIPSFVFGLICRLFALKITDNKWDGTYPGKGIEATGWDGVVQWSKVLVLPLFVIVIGGSTFMARLVRSQMLEVLRQDYIKTARAKGLAERTVIYKHAMRNALLPIVTVIALALPGLLSGAAVVEMVFNYPGMGSQLLRAAGTYDFPILMALNLYYSFTTVFMLLVADVAYGIIDPRVRF